MTVHHTVYPRVEVLTGDEGTDLVSIFGVEMEVDDDIFHELLVVLIVLWRVLQPVTNDDMQMTGIGAIIAVPALPLYIDVYIPAVVVILLQLMNHRHDNTPHEPSEIMILPLRDVTTDQ